MFPIMVTRRRIRYRKPPLIEGVVEFQFESKSNWSDDLWKSLADQLGAFPKIQALQARSVTLSLQSVEAHDEAARRFWREDGGMAVTVGPRLLAISVLPQSMAEGHRWEILRDAALRVYRIHRSVVEPAPVIQVGLRYINSVPIPDPDLFMLSDFVEAESGFVPVTLLKETGPFALRLERTLRESSALLRRENVTVAAEGDPVSGPRLILDVDEVSVLGHSTTLSSLRRMLEEMHNSIHSVFSGVIRADVLQSFEPVEP
jgi:uncharacterized protein (TIGR04255 family)